MEYPVRSLYDRQKEAQKIPEIVREELTKTEHGYYSIFIEPTKDAATEPAISIGHFKKPEEIRKSGGKIVDIFDWAINLVAKSPDISFGLMLLLSRVHNNFLDLVLKNDPDVKEFCKERNPGLKTICFPDLKDIKSIYANHRMKCYLDKATNSAMILLWDFLALSYSSLFLTGDYKGTHIRAKIAEGILDTSCPWLKMKTLFKFDEAKQEHPEILAFAALTKLLDKAYKENCYELIMSEHTKDSGYLAEQIQKKITRREKQKNPETEQALKGTKFFMSNTGAEKNIAQINGNMGIN